VDNKNEVERLQGELDAVTAERDQLLAEAKQIADITLTHITVAEWGLRRVAVEWRRRADAHIVRTALDELDDLEET
jgi:hypothetical protein